MEGKGACIELGDYFDARWEDPFTQLLGRKLEEPKATTSIMITREEQSIGRVIDKAIRFFFQRVFAIVSKGDGSLFHKIRQYEIIGTARGLVGVNLRSIFFLNECISLRGREGVSQ